MRPAKMRRIVTTTAVLGTLALAAAGCGGGSGDPGPAAAGPRSTGADAGGAPAPDAPATPEAFVFEAPALAGGRVVGADYADTGVALWFWAPW